MQNIPHLIPYLHMTHAPLSSQYPTSSGRVPQLHFLLCMDCLCQPCPASCKHSSICLQFSPCGREGVNTRVLIYLCVRLFLPRDEAAVKRRRRGGGTEREGPKKKLWWARDWQKKCLHNFNCFQTTLSLTEPPGVKGLCFTRDESL